MTPAELRAYRYYFGLTSNEMCLFFTSREGRDHVTTSSYRGWESKKYNHPYLGKNLPEGVGSRVREIFDIFEDEVDRLLEVGVIYLYRTPEELAEDQPDSPFNQFPISSRLYNAAAAHAWRCRSEEDNPPSLEYYEPLVLTQ